MKVEVTKDKDTIFVFVEGRLDTVTAPDLEAKLNDCFDNCTVLVLDFKKLDCISSAGLRVLLKSQKAMNARGKMIIKHANETIQEVFEITGFNDIFTIED